MVTFYHRLVSVLVPVTNAHTLAANVGYFARRLGFRYFGRLPLPPAVACTCTCVLTPLRRTVRDPSLRLARLCVIAFSFNLHLPFLAVRDSYMQPFTRTELKYLPIIECQTHERAP